jgi:hypothetical protein
VAQIATLLSPDERKRFAAYLLKRAEELLSEAQTSDDERRIRRALCDALSQPSLNRLRAYADGTHFPTPTILRRLAGALGGDSLFLMRYAGYDREAICDLHDLRVSNRASNDLDLTRYLIEYAVRLFPRRGEQYREHRTYSNALLEYLLSFSVTGVTARRPLAKPLGRAYDVLGDSSLEVDCRRAIAGELVRSWTYGVEPALARSIEQSAYIRVPAVGEPPQIPLLPTGAFARAVRRSKEKE